MDWITITWSMAVAASITLAMVHLGVWLKRGDLPAHLFFALAAMSVAVVGGIELTLLRTTSLARYQALMRYAEAPIWLMIVSLTGFAWCHLGARRKWLAYGAVAVMSAVVAAHLLVPPPLSIRYAVSIRTVETWGGASFTLPQIRNGLLTLGEVLGVCLLLGFVADASVGAWRRGERHRAAMVGGSIFFFLATSRLYAGLVEVGLAQSPYFTVFPFLALLGAMGHELSRDVFRAVQLGEQLRESERRMDLAARAATLGFWTWDLSHDSIWASESAYGLFGLATGQTLTFARFSECLHPDDRDAVRRAVEHTLATGDDYEMEYRVQQGDGEERWILARGRMESGSEGRPALMRGIVQDVTDRKRAELGVMALRGELAHVTRVTTLGELSASLAHELSQPLAAILSNAQAARRFLAAPGADLNEVREILDDIVKDDKRAGEVIHRLRALVQKRAGAEAEPVNVNDLVRDAERLLRSELAGRNVELTVKLSPSLPRASAGRVEIQQVLLNLVVNAMDAMRDRPLDGRRVAIETTSRDGVVLVAVRDSGNGIPEKVMPDIFRPFFSTKQHGLGMGLAISRAMIESYRGRLWAENHPAGGALFQFELPVTGEAPEP